MHIISAAIMICVLGTFAVLFWAWFLALFLGFAAIFSLAWLCGVPIKVKQNGQTKVYRWMKQIK